MEKTLSQMIAMIWAFCSVGAVISYLFNINDIFSKILKILAPAISVLLIIAALAAYYDKN